MCYNSLMEEKKFAFRCIAYQEKDSSFTGVCLDLDIVEESHATLQEAILSINDAIDSHIQVARKLGFPKELISRPAPKEYWEKLEEIANPKTQKLPFDTFQIFNRQTSVSNLNYA